MHQRLRNCWVQRESQQVDQVAFGSEIASRIMNFVVFLALNIGGSTASSFFLGERILNPK